MSSFNHENIEIGSADKINAEPVRPAEIDLVFPGEGWFLYWKTAASLWDEKLKVYLQSSPHIRQLLIPIHWSFHYQQGQYDFGEEVPETDLIRLVETVDKYGVGVMFLLPLTPFPLFPNGGVPADLAATLIQTEEGMALGIVDQLGQVNKLFSYFDPKVFRAFDLFSKKISECLARARKGIKLLGVHSGYEHEQRFHSYFEDRSAVFEEGVHKFLQLKKNEVSSFSEELIPLYYEEYERLIKDTYVQSCRQHLSDYWMGEIHLCFLGGGPFDIFERSSEKWEYASRYFVPLMNITSMRCVPSILLLAPQLRQGLLAQAVEKIADQYYLASRLKSFSLFEEDKNVFRSLAHFELHGRPEASGMTLKGIAEWEQVGLLPYLENHFRFNYHLSSRLGTFDDQEDLSVKLFFCMGRDLAYKEFLQIQRIFLGGGKVLIDKQAMSEDMERKLAGFLLENSLPLQKVNFVTEVEMAAIGTGRLVLYNGGHLLAQTLAKKISFWEHLVQYFELSMVKIECDQEIFYHWKTRGPFAHELRFEEVRRLFLWNPSSYKKLLRLHYSETHFVPLKVMNEGVIKLPVRKKDGGIEIEMAPNTSIAFDFGRIGEED